MGRHEKWDIERLKVLLYEIKIKYGVLSLETLKKAHESEPFRFPSYKTFERKLGNIRQIQSERF